MVAGRTQSGKSAVKGVLQSLCGLLGIPMIVLTKGVEESKDLHAKLVKLAQGTSVNKKHVVVAANCGKRNDYKNWRLNMQWKMEER